MGQEVRDALADLIYAVIGLVVAAVVVNINNDWVASLGKFGLLIAALYALYAMYEIAQALRSEPPKSSG